MAFWQRCAEHPLTLVGGWVWETLSTFLFLFPDPVWSASTTVNRWNLLRWRGKGPFQLGYCVTLWLSGSAAGGAARVLQQPVFHGRLASPRVADTDTEWGLGEGRFSLTTSFLRRFLTKARVGLMLMHSKLCSQHQRFLKVHLKVSLNASITLGLTCDLISRNIL